MKGGGGAGVFAFLALNETAAVRATADQIMDFVSGTAQIDVSALDGQSGGSADDAFLWIDCAAFSHTAVELRWQAVGAGVLMQGDPMAMGWRISPCC